MGVSSKTAAVAKMHGHGVMIGALLGGTEAMRAAGKSYLPQWPQEEDDGYQTRLGTSTLLPVLKETIGQMVGRVFFRDIGTDKVSDGLKTEVCMLVKLTAPEGITDVSFGGVNYAVENDIVEVAEEAVQYLHQYGFVVPAGDKPSDARLKQAEKADA